MTPRHTELILGGQRSGKSRRAEWLAREWLAASPQRRALLVATATAGDDGEMRERIARHQRERAQRVPRMATVEEPLAPAAALLAHSDARTLVVVDCLTLWLCNLLMPASAADRLSHAALRQAQQALCEAIRNAPGPVVLVSNEIGLGVIPMGAEVRGYVDALGELNQAVAAACTRATLMAAGLPLVLKGEG